MFYDLDPDTAVALRPLMEPDGTVALIAEWRKKCSVPWKTGLPWFSRLTIYGTDAESRGHLRQWLWDDVVFCRELKLISPEKAGVSVFRAEEAFALGQAAVRAGETLVVRRPDPAALARVEKIAGGDVIYFRLPDAAASSGGSLREFARRGQAGEAGLEFALEGGQLVLSNRGNGDLSPRATGDGPKDRGYAVEVEGAGPIFREAEAGDFFRVAGHRDPDSETPKRAPVPAATRLTFWFSALPAGASLKSGLFQLAPAAVTSPLRYRILNLEENPPWKPVAHSR